MTDLIKIFDTTDGKQAVSARELYCSLEIKDNFSSWFKRMVAYGFVKNVDFTSLMEKTSKPKGGRPRVDYAMTLEMAKEIAAIQRTPQGKKIREYLIDVENRYRLGITANTKPEDLGLPTNLPDAWRRMADLQDDVNKQTFLRITAEKKVEEDKPKVDYFDAVLNSNSTYTVTQIASAYGMSAMTFNQLLKDDHIQRRNNRTWVLLTKYSGHGLTRNTNYSKSTKQYRSVNWMVWTEYGRLFLFFWLFKNHNMLPDTVERDGVGDEITKMTDKYLDKSQKDYDIWSFIDSKP